MDRFDSAPVHLHIVTNRSQAWRSSIDRHLANWQSLHTMTRASEHEDSHDESAARTRHWRLCRHSTACTCDRLDRRGSVIDGRTLLSSRRRYIVPARYAGGRVVLGVLVGIPRRAAPDAAGAQVHDDGELHGGRSEATFIRPGRAASAHRAIHLGRGAAAALNVLEQQIALPTERAH